MAKSDTRNQTNASKPAGDAPDQRPAAQGSGGGPAAAATAQRFLDSNQDHYLAPQTHAVLAATVTILAARFPATIAM